MKVRGSALQRFYQAWPLGDDFYHGYGDIETDDAGVLLLDEGAMYDLDEALGEIGWQGKGEDPLHIEVAGKKVRWENGFTALYKAWAQQDDLCFLVTVPRRRPVCRLGPQRRVVDHRVGRAGHGGCSVGRRTESACACVSCVDRGGVVVSPR